MYVNNYKSNPHFHINIYRMNFVICWRRKNCYACICVPMVKFNFIIYLKMNNIILVYHLRFLSKLIEQNRTFQYLHNSAPLTSHPTHPFISPVSCL